MHHDESAGQSLPLCAVAECVLEDIRVQVPGCAIAVQKYGLGAEKADRIATGDEGKSGAEDLVARPDAEKAQPEVYGGGPTDKRDSRLRSSCVLNTPTGTNRTSESVVAAGAS